MSGNGDSNPIVNLGYLAFGLMWLAFVPDREPLCAAYVSTAMEDSADNNPLFMKTNYILAACWGNVRFNRHLELVCGLQWSGAEF